MALAFGSITTASVDSGTVTVAKPGGTVAGDRLVAVQELDDGAPGLSALTGASGWTAIDAGKGIAGVGYSKAWTRVAGASEPASYVFPGDPNATNQIAVLRFTDTGTPGVGAIAWGGSATAAASQGAPTVTSVAAGAQLVGSWCSTGSSAARYSTSGGNIPVGMTLRADFESPSNYLGTGVATQALPTAGATGTNTATASAARPYISMALVIEMAAGGGQQAGAATLTAASSLTATGRGTTQGGTTLAGSSSLTASGSAVVPATSELAGESAITATVIAAIRAQATLSAISQSDHSAYVITSGVVHVAGIASLGASSGGLTPATVALAGVTELGAEVTRTALAAARLTGDSDLLVGSVVNRPAVAMVVGVGGLVATATELTIVAAAAVLAAVSTLVAVTVPPRDVTISWGPLHTGTTVGPLTLNMSVGELHTATIIGPLEV